jgi:hypothetical protein
VEKGRSARLKRLASGAAHALEILANGFLRHPANATLREQVVVGRIRPDDYYQQLVLLVCRLLVLLVAEGRGLVSAGLLARHACGDERWAGIAELFRRLRVGSEEVVSGQLFGPAPFEAWRLDDRDFEAALFAVTGAPDRGRTSSIISDVVLDIADLGSVYEGLLEYYPVMDSSAEHPFSLKLGTERKRSGSYYTPSELIQKLIESALEPVLAGRVGGKRSREEREGAILSLKVCDPAVGSGHFLLAAARRLAHELARVRSGGDDPQPDMLDEALRDVITSCLYGVDKDPIAVELCKATLWVEGRLTSDALSVLDEHIRCGDSLVGVFDIAVLRDGIPDEAYAASGPSDEPLTRAWREHNRQERSGQLTLWGAAAGVDEALSALDDYRQLVERVASMPEGTMAERLAKRGAYARLRCGESAQRVRLACDLWTAAFFVDLTDHASVPTTDHVRRALAGRWTDQTQLEVVQELAEEMKFFHWPLAFPDVFAAGGFDVVLCNPPWERLRLEDKQFFAARDPGVAGAPTTAERKRRIDELTERNPELVAAYRSAQRRAQRTIHFCQDSGRFPLSGRGDQNTYQVFTELAWQLLADGGRAGLVVPTNIVTDDTTKVLFRALVDRRALVSLYDFQNRYELFPSVSTNQRFCLMTLARGGYDGPIMAAFGLYRVDDLSDDSRQVALTSSDFWLVNPNTGTCPTFRSVGEAEIVRAIYRRVPVLVEENSPDGNSWGVSLWDMLDTSKDSAIFRTREQLERDGFELLGNLFVRGHERYVPLYEAKMLHQFDHRWASFGGPGRWEAGPMPECGPPWLEKPFRGRGEPVGLSLQAKQDPYCVVLPRFWVPETEVEARLERKGWVQPWLLGWRAITHVANEKVFIAVLFPRVGAADSLSVLLPVEQYVPLVPCLLANLNAVVVDFVARNKIGGLNLNFFAVKQLPVLPPAVFVRHCPWHARMTLADWIRPRVLELVYTAWDVEPFARDIGDSGPPFRWDAERRIRIRAELDAAFFVLYGLNRDDVVLVLDTLHSLRTNEQKVRGEFRTASLVLAAYDAMMTAMEQREPYRPSVDPPPGDDRARVVVNP